MNIDVCAEIVRITVSPHEKFRLGFELKTFWILVRRSCHWTSSQGVEEKLHMQHCLEVSAELQLILTLSQLD